ncbi:MAG: class I lanthipeptide [Flavobacterium sp.]|uniref:class I lanthipeptide n=1 Tax=Flavobacterium sp. TaxID=239 RepID=UPI0032648F9D
MKKFEILNLEKKAIARLNDQQIIAVKGGVSKTDVCVFKTSTINCNVAGATVISPASAEL